MSRGPSVIVAGAGVFGLACALALADAGCAVTVVDPGGGNASGVAAGMLAPALEAVLDPAARPHLGSLLAAQALWPGLAARIGVTLNRTGALAVGGADWLTDVRAGFAALGLAVRAVDGAEAGRLAPGLSAERALFTEADWSLDAPGALAALRAAAAAAGVGFRAGRLSAADVREQVGAGGLCVIATGAAGDLAAAAPELGLLRPIKGQLVRLDAARGGAVVRGEGIYVAPGAGAAFGATMEPGRADLAPDAALAEGLRARGLALFPGLAAAGWRTEVGVRAETPDGLPLAGRSQADGVWLAVGARRNGWLLAPLVAQAVAAGVTGGDAGAQARAFAPGRFGKGRG